MPTKIGPNNQTLYGGLFLIVLLPAFLIIFGYLMLPDALSEIRRDGFTWNAVPICIFPILLLFMGIKQIFKFLTMPFWAIVDDDMKTLELKYVFQKPRLIRRDHIVSYENAEVEEKTRSVSTRYLGFTIQLVDGSSVLASERGLSDILYITSMLDYWGVKRLEGEEHFDV